MCSLFLALIADFVNVSAEKYRHQEVFIEHPRLTLWEVPVIGLEADFVSRNRCFELFDAASSAILALSGWMAWARELEQCVRSRCANSTHGVTS
jgi:hypothetical protein